jgi:flavin reductase (DIM6/NTAB) family NADH-FMN oxidoreductase RutF
VDDHLEAAMHQPTPLDFWDQVPQLLARMRSYGVLCTVVDGDTNSNILTLGWCLVGPTYNGNPIVVVAITPLRYSWEFIEAVPEFVLGIPNDALTDAVDLCGTCSGRHNDKFIAAQLTPIASEHVRAPSILECPANIECRVYESVHPPHYLLTPRHREQPIREQHTIYFAEVLGTYSYI